LALEADNLGPRTIESSLLRSDMGRTTSSQRVDQVGIAILGCGYVANMYRLTLPLHPELKLVGVFDRERSRGESMARLTGARAYGSFEEMARDDSVQIVLNLTNPASHWETTDALLRAGRHVYTEKPLAMRVDDAAALASLARDCGLMLCSAPCTLLSPVAQTVFRLLRRGDLGTVRLVYAEMEDGMVSRAPIGKWVNEAGVAWPAIDEFQVGCTIEHAGYVLSWLCAYFGGVETVHAFSETILPDKISGILLENAPDFSVSCLRFRTGVVARMTNGIYGEHDHRLRFFGDEGVLEVEDPRSDDSPIWMRRYRTVRRRRFLTRRSQVALDGARERITRYRGSQTRDFCRVIGDMAAAIRGHRDPYMGAEFALHVAEATLASHRGTTSAHAAAVPYRIVHPCPMMDPVEA
jgi:predicted dehydrogenase